MNFEHEYRLVAAAQKDRAAFGELFDMYYDKILRYAVRRTGNVALAEDITAQTFAKAMENIGKFTPRGVSFGSWLYKIATNELRMYYRAPKHTLSLDFLRAENDFEPPSDINIEEEAMAAQEVIERNELFLQAQKQIANMPLKYQEVLTLRFVEDKKISEIAAITGRKEGTVKSLISRGLTKLRQQMQPKRQGRIVTGEDKIYKQSPERNV